MRLRGSGLVPRGGGVGLGPPLGRVPVQAGELKRKNLITKMKF